MIIIRKVLYSLLVIGMVFPAIVFGQVEQGGEPRFDLDFARFKAARDQTHLEVYFAIPREMLEYKLDSETSKYEASYEVEVNLFLADSLVTTGSWKSFDRVDSLSQIKKGQSLYELYSGYLEKGDYKLRSKVRDLNGEKEGWHDCNLEIFPFPAKGLDLSDIQLSLWAVPDTSKGRFVKSGILIYPNPTGIYNTNWPNLFYYSEIYNLARLEDGTDSTYTVQVAIKNATGNIVKQLPPKIRKRIGTSIVELGKIEVSSLVSGPYQLQIDVIDGATAVTVSGEKRFFFYQPLDLSASKQPDVDDIKVFDEYSGMNEEELDEQFEMTLYIAKKNEKKIYKKLNLEGKREFLNKFWKKRDKDKSTGVNEYKQEYLQRAAIAAVKYRSGTKKGWQTDQGRVFIIYGEADRIDRYTQSTSKNPYEIWSYDTVQGGIEFIFVDTSGYGVLRLVHSTSRDEIQDHNWQERWVD